MKSKVDNLDNYNLKALFVDLIKLSDVGGKEVVKEDVYDDLVKKVNAIDTNELVKKQIITLKLMRLKVKYLILLA